jgi:DNA repair exonuclease SbcCD ATPase subunit
MTTTPEPKHGDNGGPPLDDDFAAIEKEILDLYDEAKNWADGEPIANQEVADAITTLYEALHDAGKRADELRTARKKPLDEQIKAIQDQFNPLVQPKKGKVALGKDALGALLTTWRTAQQREAAQKAAEAAAQAAEKEAEAVAAMRASSGDLEAREVAEALLEEAKYAQKFAKRADKAANTGTGLRTVWITEVVDEGAALDWAYGQAPGEFMALAKSMAEARVRAGVRELPGFLIKEGKVAA